MCLSSVTSATSVFSFRFASRKGALNAINLSEGVSDKDSPSEVPDSFEVPRIKGGQRRSRQTETAENHTCSALRAFLTRNPVTRVPPTWDDLLTES
jgi:hypothetical protein